MARVENNPDPSGRSSRPLPGAYMALSLLLAMNLFNYIDRQVLAAVEPEIRQTFLAGASPNDPALATKLGPLGSVLLNLASRLHGGHMEHALSGLLASAFLVMYMFAAPLFARLARAFRAGT